MVASLTTGEGNESRRGMYIYTLSTTTDGPEVPLLAPAALDTSSPRALQPSRDTTTIQDN